MTDDQAKKTDEKAPVVAEPLPEPVTREHQVTIRGKKLDYTTTAGQLPIKNDKGEAQVNLYFTAYNLTNGGGDEPRPLTFVFNGGPGSASVWLHMGGLAPKRVEMLDDGSMPRPPYKIIANDYTWFESTDLVFIDPVDTGYSRAVTEEAGKAAKDKDGDLASVGEFIRLYLSKYKRWTSPLFLSG
jgi:carboxypeptidase C (cathepsin A)